MTTERIPLAGVIGSPIAHSKSPQLHHHWLRTYGLRGHYIPMDVSTDNLKSVLETLPKMGFVGGQYYCSTQGTRVGYGRSDYRSRDAYRGRRIR